MSVSFKTLGGWILTALLLVALVHVWRMLPLTAIMSLALLPVAKGATVGLQWALRMEGFGRTG